MSAIIEQGPVAVFFALAIMHALADFPLQSPYMVKQKSRRHADSVIEWQCSLWAHSLIQAGGVWLITGSILLAAIELVLHAIIDTCKSEDFYGLFVDQSLHLGCKLAFTLALCYWW